MVIYGGKLILVNFKSIIMMVIVLSGLQYHKDQLVFRVLQVLKVCKVQ